MRKTNSTKELPKRRTILEQAGDVKIRDPASFSRHQVSELDKTAKNSMLKRKMCQDQIETDSKEIDHINDQIARIKVRYDPLCEILKERQDKKKYLLQVLEECIKDEKRIMGETKDTVSTRILDDFKLSRRTATMELQTIRGYTMTPESTFHQTRGSHGSGTFGSTGMSGIGTSTSGFGNTSGSLPAIRNKLASARVTKS